MYEFRLSPSVSISFQRYPYPPSGFVAALPTSWGALPMIADTPGHLLLPSPGGEAFWIGLIPEQKGRSAMVQVLAVVASGDLLDVVTGSPLDRSLPAASHPAGSAGIKVPAAHGVAGISRGDETWWAFARDAGGEPAMASRSLELFSSPAGFVRVDLIGADEFETLAGTGLPRLDPAGRYGGWRLP